VQCTKISPEFVCQGQRSKVKVTRDKNEKTAESSPLTVHSKACATAPYAAGSSRLYHCVAAGGDRVTAVQADGGLRERSSVTLRPPVLRRWENQRILFALLATVFAVDSQDTIICNPTVHDRAQTGIVAIGE